MEEYKSYCKVNYLECSDCQPCCESRVELSDKEYESLIKAHKEEKKVIGKLVLGDRLYIESPCGERYYLEDIIRNGILNDLKNK